MFKQFSLIVFFLLAIPLFSKEKICLNMIVKNESAVIERCLDSVKHLIDYWVIVDTGSTDETKEIIKKYLKAIPGELHERPWVNFGHNRSEALELAKTKGDYILFMDADDVLEFEKDFIMPPLKEDLYNMWRGPKGFTYIKPQLVRASLPWKWVGVTHEYLECQQLYSSTILEKVRYLSKDDGASSKDPRKLFKNVELLEEGLRHEPRNSRYMFYLAESYRQTGEKGKALEHYQKRVQMGGWEEEIFWSMLQIGHLLRDMHMPSNLVIEAYKNAHRFRPHRVEPIYYLAEIYIEEKEYEKAYEHLKTRMLAPQQFPKDMLFNMDWIHDYGLLFQLSICSYYIGKYQESLNACNKLLQMKDLPESWREQTKYNKTFPLDKIKNKHRPASLTS